MEKLIYKLRRAGFLCVILLCNTAAVFTFTGLRNNYREYKPYTIQMNTAGDFNNYIQTADSLYNNNGKLDCYGEALCASAIFLKQNNKYGFVRFADYLAKLGYPMDIDNILHSIQNDRKYYKIPEITTPPEPDSIEGLIALRKEYMKDIKRMDSLVENFRSEYKKKFIRGKDLFTALNEMDKDTRLTLWAQQNIRRCEPGNVTDAKTYGGPIENREFRDYLKFSSMNDSLLAETYSFLEECFRIAEFSEMLDAETARLYYLDSLLDKYGEKFLNYLGNIDYESLLEYGEATAGGQVNELEGKNRKELQGLDNSDIDTITSAVVVNEKLLLLYHPLDSINTEIDNINILIEKHNNMLFSFRASIDSLDKWEKRFEKESSTYASACNSFAKQNQAALNPLMCFGKWNLFRNGYLLKAEGWALLGENYSHNGIIMQLRAQEKEFSTKIMQLKNMKEEYLKRYNLLKAKFRHICNN